MRIANSRWFSQGWLHTVHWIGVADDAFAWISCLVHVYNYDTVCASIFSQTELLAIIFHSLGIYFGSCSWHFKKSISDKLKSTRKLNADENKIIGSLYKQTNKTTLQDNIDEIQTWFTYWFVSLNFKKCTWVAKTRLNLWKPQTLKRYQSVNIE